MCLQSPHHYLTPGDSNQSPVGGDTCAVRWFSVPSLDLCCLQVNKPYYKIIIMTCFLRFIHSPWTLLSRSAPGYCIQVFKELLLHEWCFERHQSVARVSMTTALTPNNANSRRAYLLVASYVLSDWFTTSSGRMEANHATPLTWKSQVRCAIKKFTCIR